MEQLQKMIDTAKNGVVSQYLMEGEFAAQVQGPVSSDAIQNKSFIMGIDVWGTSLKKVGK